MLGRGHLLLGAAGWLTVGAPTLKLAGVDLGPAELAAGTVVAAGAAMLPDLDHPKATASQSLGPITGAISKVLRTAAGGHRQGTHSLLFVLLVGLGTAALGAGTGGPWATLLICFFLSSLLFRVLTEANGAICAALSMLVAGALLPLVGESDWLWLAVALGTLLHLVGDVLTPEGVPPLWPLSKWRLSIPIIGHTGDWREWLIGTACGILTLWLLVAGIFIPMWDKEQRVQAKEPPQQAKSLNY